MKNTLNGALYILFLLSAKALGQSGGNYTITQSGSAFASAL